MNRGERMGIKRLNTQQRMALGLKRILIALWQLVHAAEIVVHHAHIHAAFRLAAQHLVNGVPHRAGGDDVVLHENELLRLFQLRQKRVKIDLADRKIRCFGMREYRAPAARCR